jgi:hypothetical protein
MASTWIIPDAKNFSSEIANQKKRFETRAKKVCVQSELEKNDELNKDLFGYAATITLSHIMNNDSDLDQIEFHVVSNLPLSDKFIKQYISDLGYKFHGYKLSRLDTLVAIIGV